MNNHIFVNKVLFIILLFITSGSVFGQEYVYVNTDNLILRDRPEKVYIVFAILHAPSRLKIEPYENGYKNDPAITKRFYQVSISYKDNDGIYHYTDGWVEKKYVVDDPDKITVTGVDKHLDLTVTEPFLVPFMGEVEQDPNNGNAREFQAPKYKGGEKEPEPFKRVYHKGPRGGCYYVNGKGKKIYVDKGFCKDK